MGRPTVITKNVINKLEEAFAFGCTDAEAALYANIAPSTLYKYQEVNTKFSERKEQLKMMPVLHARMAVVNAIKKDPHLALKYLERKKSDEFRIQKMTDNRSILSFPKPILSLKGNYFRKD